MIYLHIGRGKAGSTTIQNFIGRNERVLSAAGYRVPQAPLGSWIVAFRIRNYSPVPFEDARRAWMEMAEDRHGTYLVSSEFLHGYTDPRKIEALVSPLWAHGIRVICYLRDYRSLLPSLYNQATKKSKNIEDFDGYFEKWRSRVSSVPSLKAWGQVLGWGRMRVRTLHRESLVGGDLVRDYIDAIDGSAVTGLSLSDEASNVSDNWVVIELLRAASARLLAAGYTLDDPAVRKLFSFLRQQGQKLEPAVVGSDVRYLTPEQQRILGDLFEKDMSFLEGLVDPAGLRRSPVPEMERRFLPTEETLPNPVWERLRATAKDVHGAAIRSALGVAFPRLAL